MSAVGLLAAAVIALLPTEGRSTVAWWILSSALVPERMLPLAGVGIALALVRLRYCLAALGLFGGGMAIGFIAHDRLLSALEEIPQATSHHFLIGPISSVTIGLALVLPGVRLRSWLLLFAAAVSGSLWAVAIEVTDPEVDDLAIPVAGVVVGIWIVLAVSLTARAFQRGWFSIPARIFGSWLIAIGILYGAASLVPKHQSLFSSPAASIPNYVQAPGLDRLPFDDSVPESRRRKTNNGIPDEFQQP